MLCVKSVLSSVGPESREEELTPLRHVEVGVEAG